MATPSNKDVNLSTDKSAEAPSETVASAGPPSRPASRKSERRFTDLPVRGTRAEPDSQSLSASGARAVLAAPPQRRAPPAATPGTELHAIGASRPPSASVDVQAPGSGVATLAQTRRPSSLSKVLSHPHALPGTESTAAVLNVVGDIASKTSPLAKSALGGTSGFTWGVSGAIGIATRKVDSKADYLGHASSLVAGGAQTLGNILKGSAKETSDRVSVAAWGTGSVLKMGKAAHDFLKGRHHVTVNVAEGLSGALNVAGAATGFLAQKGGPNALPISITSNLLWAGGSGMQHLAEHLKKRYAVQVAAATSPEVGSTAARAERPVTPDHAVVSASGRSGSSLRPSASPQPSASPRPSVSPQPGTPPRRRALPLAKTPEASRPPTPASVKPATKAKSRSASPQRRSTDGPVIE